MDIFKIISKLCFIKIIISLLLGLMMAFYLTPKSHHFNTIAANYATNFFETHFDCSATFTIDQINIFHGKCVLKDVLVKPKNRLSQQWQWSCKQLECQVDWLVFITKHIFKTRLRLENLSIHTNYYAPNHHLAIAPHLRSLLFTPSSIPFELSNIDIKQGQITILDQDQGMQLKLHWHSQTKLLENILKTKLYLKNSQLALGDQTYFDQLTGPIQINSCLANNEMIINGDIHLTLPGLDQHDQYFLKFKYANQKIIAKLNSLKGATNLTINATCPTNLNQTWQIETSGWLPNFTNNNLITLQAKIDQFNHLHGSCHIENLGKMDFTRQNGLWTGEFNLPNNDLVLPIFWQLNEHTGQLDSSCDLKLMHSWLPKNVQSLLTCEGKLAIKSSLKDHNLYCTIKLVDGNLIFPKIYSVIYDLSSTINFNLKTKRLDVSRTTINLHQGKIEIPRATMSWSHSYFPDYIYLPAILTNCVINYDKQLLGSFHGRILYQKNLNLTDRVTGFVALEQGLCKYNLLSDDFISSLSQTTPTPLKFGFNPVLDLSFFTLSPIKIQSEPLQTSVTTKLQISKELLSPQVIGEIDIIGGKINFPYKPLYITHGNIHFTAEQPDSAIINLGAKNQIKLHNINMQINGPLKNPQINLESFPDLTNEQIGALLLVGSENSSLNHSMPTIIMQNLNQAVFGLNHVKFIPTFSNEAGHPGLTGAVEIDVDDRLHASIKKNFSAQQDTKFEVDYAVTDNVSIRGIKDERGDLGGEIEIRLRI